MLTKLEIAERAVEIYNEYAKNKYVVDGIEYDSRGAICKACSVAVQQAAEYQGFCDWNYKVIWFIVSNELYNNLNHYIKTD